MLNRCAGWCWRRKWGLCIGSVLSILAVVAVIAFVPFSDEGQTQTDTNTQPPPDLLCFDLPNEIDLSLWKDGVMRYGFPEGDTLSLDVAGSTVRVTKVEYTDGTQLFETYPSKAQPSELPYLKPIKRD